MNFIVPLLILKLFTSFINFVLKRLSPILITNKSCYHTVTLPALAAVFNSNYNPDKSRLKSFKREICAEKLAFKA